jgi:hypothetical protein
MLTIGLTIFLLVSVIASATAIYYYQQYSNTYQKYVTAEQNFLAIKGVTLNVSMTINYGNGTSVTTNPLYLSLNASVLDALKAVATVNATYYAEYQSFFVNAINGLWNNQTNYWEYSVNGQMASVGADQYKLNNGDQVEWIYS